MKRERKELNKKTKVDDTKPKKPRQSVDTKNADEENVKLLNLENKKSKRTGKDEKLKESDAPKSKLKTTPIDEMIDETIKNATIKTSKKSSKKNVNEAKTKTKKAVDEPKNKLRKPVDEPKSEIKKQIDEPKNKLKKQVDKQKSETKEAVNEMKKELKRKPVDELIDETLLEINTESDNKTITDVESKLNETISNSFDKSIKTSTDKKNKKLTKNANKPTKESLDESIKTSNEKELDTSIEPPSKKVKKNTDLLESNLNESKDDLSDKTELTLTDSKQSIEEFKSNLSNKTTDEVYKLKISKNSIKLKNIEAMYPNNIGVEETKSSFLILYKNAKTAKKDLRLNEKYKFYNDKLIISNFSYKENEESIKNFLSDLGEVVDISLEKNKDDVFTGKAVVTFESSVKIDKELKLNNKVLRVERIRKQAVNDRRIFIGRIDMNLSIMDIRKVIKEAGAKVIDVRIRYEKDTHKNIGYGHLSFKTREDAIKFENNFQNIKKTLGPHSFYEYAKEKFMASRKK